MRMLDDEDDESEKRKKPNTKRLLSIEGEKGKADGYEFEKTKPREASADDCI